MLCYTILFVILLILELLYFKIADKYNIIDKPNSRSSHTGIILRGGGVVFYLGALMYGIISGFNYPWFLLGLTLISGISFLDDIHSVSNKIRIVFHISAMLLMFYQLGILATVSWWYILLAIFICTGIINAFNFLDGINGMTGGYSLVVTGVLMALNRRYDFIDPELLYLTVISLLVFCVFNFRGKAKCFAGDIGAVSIAFIVLFAIGSLIIKTQSIYYLILLAVYGVDSVFTITKRLINRENIFEAHRKHAYQIMSNEFRIPQVVVSGIYMLLQLIISIGAICCEEICPWGYWSGVILMLSMGYFIIMALLRKKQRQ